MSTTERLRALGIRTTDGTVRAVSARDTERPTAPDGIVRARLPDELPAVLYERRERRGSVWRHRHRWYARRAGVYLGGHDTEADAWAAIQTDRDARA